MCLVCFKASAISLNVNGTNEVVIKGLPANKKGEVLLLNDLSVSLTQGLAMTTNQEGLKGTVIKLPKDLVPTEIIATLANGNADNFFAAFREEGSDTWVPCMDTKGNPKAVLVGGKAGGLKLHSRKIGENKSVVRLNFFVKDGASITRFLVPGFDPTGVNLSASSSVEDALTSNNDYICFKQTLNNDTYYTLYYIENAAEHSVEIMTSASEDSLRFKVVQAEDPQFNNIVKDLIHLASREKGEAPGSVNKDESLNLDRLSLKAAVMIDRGIFHTSPVLNMALENKGISTSYTQLMHVVFKNWETLKEVSTGSDRLKSILQLVKAEQKKAVFEPMTIVNNGVSSNLGNDSTATKNYLYTDAYSRIDVKVSFKDTTITDSSGITVLMRVSDTATIFAPASDSPLEMFKTPTIGSHSVDSNAIIFTCDSSDFLSNLETYGLWMRGKEPSEEATRGEDTAATPVKDFYFTLKPIRQPLVGYEIDSVISLLPGEKLMDDMAGVVNGSRGDDIITVEAMDGDKPVNTPLAKFLLPGQERRITFDEDFLKGNDLSFEIVQGADLISDSATQSLLNRTNSRSLPAFGIVENVRSGENVYTFKIVENAAGNNILKIFIRVSDGKDFIGYQVVELPFFEFGPKIDQYFVIPGSNVNIDPGEISSGGNKAVENFLKNAKVVISHDGNAKIDKENKSQNAPFTENKKKNETDSIDVATYNAIDKMEIQTTAAGNLFFKLLGHLTPGSNDIKEVLKKKVSIVTKDIENTNRVIVNKFFMDRVEPKMVDIDGYKLTFRKFTDSEIIAANDTTDSLSAETVNKLDRGDRIIVHPEYNNNIPLFMYVKDVKHEGDFVYVSGEEIYEAAAYGNFTIDTTLNIGFSDLFPGKDTVITDEGVIITNTGFDVEDFNDRELSRRGGGKVDEISKILNKLSEAEVTFDKDALYITLKKELKDLDGNDDTKYDKIYAELKLIWYWPVKLKVPFEEYKTKGIKVIFDLGIAFDFAFVFGDTNEPELKSLQTEPGSKNITLLEVDQMVPLGASGLYWDPKVLLGIDFKWDLPFKLPISASIAQEIGVDFKYNREENADVSDLPFYDYKKHVIQIDNLYRGIGDYIALKARNSKVAFVADLRYLVPTQVKPKSKIFIKIFDKKLWDVGGESEKLDADVMEAIFGDISAQITISLKIHAAVLAGKMLGIKFNFNAMKLNFLVAPLQNPWWKISLSTNADVGFGLSEKMVQEVEKEENELIRSTVLGINNTLSKVKFKTKNLFDRTLISAPPKDFVVKSIPEDLSDALFEWKEYKNFESIALVHEYYDIAHSTIDFKSNKMFYKSPKTNFKGYRGFPHSIEDLNNQAICKGRINKYSLYINDKHKGHYLPAHYLLYGNRPPDVNVYEHNGKGFNEDDKGYSITIKEGKDLYIKFKAVDKDKGFLHTRPDWLKAYIDNTSDETFLLSNQYNSNVDEGVEMTFEVKSNKRLNLGTYTPFIKVVDNRDNTLISKKESGIVDHYEGYQGKTWFDLMVNVVENSAPVIQEINPSEEGTLYRNKHYTWEVIAHDPDYDYINYRVEPVDDNMKMLTLGGNGTENTGLLQWTAKESGEYKVKVIAEDDDIVNPGIDDSVYTITVVNRAPVINSLDTISEDCYVNTNCKWQIIASDPENDVLTYSLGTGHTEDIRLDLTSGIVSFTPKNGMSDSFHKIEVVANDGEKNSIPKSFSLYIENRAPIINTEILAKEEYRIAHGNHPLMIPLIANDIDGDLVEISINQEDEILLNNYGIKLIKEGGKYHLKSFEGKVLYNEDEATTISFSIVANDGKKNGVHSITHDITIHPNYLPEIEAIGSKKGINGAPDTLLYPVGTHLNEKIVVTDLNQDIVSLNYLSKNIPITVDIIEDQSNVNQFFLQYEADEINDYAITLVADDGFGGVGKLDLIVMVVPDKYTVYFMPFHNVKYNLINNVTDKDLIYVYQNDIKLKWWKKKSLFPLDGSPQSTPYTNLSFSTYYKYTRLMDFGDNIFIEGGVNNKSEFDRGNSINMCWYLSTADDDNIHLPNFPFHDSDQDIFFNSSSQRYNYEYSDDLDFITRYGQDLKDSLFSPVWVGDPKRHLKTIGIKYEY